MASVSILTAAVSQRVVFGSRASTDEPEREPPAPARPPAPPAEPHPAPGWLAQRLRAAGGSVPFVRYMHWALHDPEHGAYGSGRLQIGPRGDFATSPSLGPAFAALLAPQIAAWLQELGPGPLALVETGPGEGALARQLGDALLAGWPELSSRLELVLVEPNPGMRQRQRQRLEGMPLPIRWSSAAALAAAPLRGVMLAHEVLDALAVQRVQWNGSGWQAQLVALTPSGGLTLQAGPAAAPWALSELERLGLLQGRAVGGEPLPPGWSSELHPGTHPWLAEASAGLMEGPLLIVDYALEARRYYASHRSGGTLMAYRAQQASGDPLLDPGHWDLTAHLCLETLQHAAAATGWRWLGSCRQGEALLALGLAQALHGLQAEAGGADLAQRLASREALLRLVDPAGLGDFRWIALARESGPPPERPLFLREPGLA